MAKNEAAQASLARQLKDREVHKVYLALVQGRVEPPEGVIDAPIGRHPRRRQRMAVVEGGRAALTRYRVREYLRATPTRWWRRSRSPAARTRSGCTSPASAIRWWATGCTARRRRWWGGSSSTPGGWAFACPRAAATSEFESPLPADLEAALEALRRATDRGKTFHC